MFEKTVHSPIQKLQSKLLYDKGINLYIKRDDLIHPEVSGNKWRKLKYNLLEAREKGFTTLLTFGGAYSNHIDALAKAAQLLGFSKTIGCIRGEGSEGLNATLLGAQEAGMEFYFMDRTTYRDKTNPNLIQNLKNQFGDFYLVPEGGTNELAVKGCKELVDEINIDFDVIACACGTGGTISGIIQGLDSQQSAIGIPVLKGADFLNKDIKQLSKVETGWELDLDYHFGGYAKINDELLQFIDAFKQEHQILLDPVYTGKLLYGIFDLIKKDKFRPNSTIVVVHSGGVQGWKGFLERGLIEKDYYERLHTEQ